VVFIPRVGLAVKTKRRRRKVEDTENKMKTKKITIKTKHSAPFA
jgi:hypothetical protein